MSRPSINLKGVLFRLLSVVFVAAALLIDAENSSNFSLVFYGFIMFFAPAILTFAFAKFNLKAMKYELVHNKIGLIVIGLIGALGYYFIIKSYALVDKTIALPLNSTTTIFTVILGAIFLKETKDLTRKIIATMVVFAGVVILGLS